LQLFEDLSVELFPAGHLPGAAAILLTYTTPKRTYKLFYTGDFSLSNLQLVEGLSVESLRGLAPDILIIEGSYGTARHPHRRQQEKHLMERIHQALDEQMNVLLPVPTLGVGQEILKLLRSHHQFTGKNLDIWVEGSVAQGCDVYLQLLDRFPISVQNFAKHQPLFWDERICPRLRRMSGSDRPTPQQAPYIVLVDEAADWQPYCNPAAGSWLILLPEHRRRFLSEAQLCAIEQVGHIKLETYLLAEHSDGRNTIQLIHNLRPQHIIFVHGSPAYLADLTSLEELQNRYQLHSPSAGTLVELPIGDKFIQPAAPSPTYYEGELNELETALTITLPDTISNDPRWSQFADTGLIEARWQGEDLLLRGVSQRELLSQNYESRTVQGIDCCQTCRHFRGQRCWNSASPLYGFKVMPEGYCPVFEPMDSPM
jgi:Cft2 family RNA processing exonuclease